MLENQQSLTVWLEKEFQLFEDVAGVTRDRIYAKASWLTKEFSVIDTGGIELENASFNNTN